MGKVPFSSGLGEEARGHFIDMLRDIPASLDKLLEVLSLLKTCKWAENGVCSKGSSKFCLGSHIADILDNLLVGLLSSLLSHVLSYAEILWVLSDCGFFSFEGIQIWWALVLASDLNSTISHIFRIQRGMCRKIDL